MIVEEVIWNYIKLNSIKIEEYLSPNIFVQDKNLSLIVNVAEYEREFKLPFQLSQDFMTMSHTYMPSISALNKNILKFLDLKINVLNSKDGDFNKKVAMINFDSARKNLYKESSQSLVLPFEGYKKYWILSPIYT